MSLDENDLGYLGWYMAGKNNSYFPPGTQYACWAVGWTGIVARISGIRGKTSTSISLPGWTGTLHVEVTGPEYERDEDFRMSSRMQAALEKLSLKVAFGLRPLQRDSNVNSLDFERIQIEFLETLQGTSLELAARSVILDIEMAIENVYREFAPDDFIDNRDIWTVPQEPAGPVVIPPHRAWVIFEPWLGDGWLNSSLTLSPIMPEAGLTSDEKERVATARSYLVGGRPQILVVFEDVAVAPDYDPIEGCENYRLKEWPPLSGEPRKRHTELDRTFCVPGGGIAILHELGTHIEPFSVAG